MPETRVDQGGLYALAGAVPEVRVDQAGLYALAIPGVEVRVDQAGVYVLVAIRPVVPVAQAGMYALASGSPCSTRWAQIWTIRRTDGEVFRFTSKDSGLEYPAGSGISHLSCDSLVPSASEGVAEVDAAGSMDLSGAVGEGEGRITAFDLYAGLFDGAEVEAWRVPWAGEGRPQRLLKGTFAPVEFGETGFNVELAGDGEKMKQTPLVRLLGPNCWKKFGGPFCQKALGPLTVTGTVVSATGQRSFADAARGEAAGYFSRGVVTFTSGDNSGVSAEIKAHTAGGNFELWPRLPFAIAAGDQYSMTPGCTHLRAASGGTNGCTAWANDPNFGGAENVPGGDKRSSPKVTKANG